MKHDVFDELTDSFEGRGLTEWMLRQLIEPEGLLHPVLAAVRSDPDGALELEIRWHYVNIYYRGANLMEVRQPSPRSSRLTGRFDRRYLQKYAARPWGARPPPRNLLSTNGWTATRSSGSASSRSGRSRVACRFVCLSQGGDGRQHGAAAQARA